MQSAAAKTKSIYSFFISEAVINATLDKLREVFKGVEAEALAMFQRYLQLSLTTKDVGQGLFLEDFNKVLDVCQQAQEQDASFTFSKLYYQLKQMEYFLFRNILKIKNLEGSGNANAAKLLILFHKLIKKDEAFERKDLAKALQVKIRLLEKIRKDKFWTQTFLDLDNLYVDPYVYLIKQELERIWKVLASLEGENRLQFAQEIGFSTLQHLSQDIGLESRVVGGTTDGAKEVIEALQKSAVPFFGVTVPVRRENKSNVESKVASGSAGAAGRLSTQYNVHSDEFENKVDPVPLDSSVQGFIKELNGKITIKGLAFWQADLSITEVDVLSKKLDDLIAKVRRGEEQTSALAMFCEVNLEILDRLLEKRNTELLHLRLVMVRVLLTSLERESGMADAFKLLTHHLEVFPKKLGSNHFETFKGGLLDFALRAEDQSLSADILKEKQLLILKVINLLLSKDCVSDDISRQLNVFSIIFWIATECEKKNVAYKVLYDELRIREKILSSFLSDLSVSSKDKEAIRKLFLLVFFPLQKMQSKFDKLEAQQKKSQQKKERPVQATKLAQETKSEDKKPEERKPSKSQVRKNKKKESELRKKAAATQAGIKVEVADASIVGKETKLAVAESLAETISSEQTAVQELVISTSAAVIQESVVQIAESREPVKAEDTQLEKKAEPKDKEPVRAAKRIVDERPITGFKGKVKEKPMMGSRGKIKEKPMKGSKGIVREKPIKEAEGVKSRAPVAEKQAQSRPARQQRRWRRHKPESVQVKPAEAMKQAEATKQAEAAKPAEIKKSDDLILSVPFAEAKRSTPVEAAPFGPEMPKRAFKLGRPSVATVALVAEIERKDDANIKWLMGLVEGRESKSAAPVPASAGVPVEAPAKSEPESKSSEPFAPEIVITRKKVSKLRLPSAETLNLVQEIKQKEAEGVNWLIDLMKTKKEDKTVRDQQPLVEEVQPQQEQAQMQTLASQSPIPMQPQPQALSQMQVMVPQARQPMFFSNPAVMQREVPPMQQALPMQHALPMQQALPISQSPSSMRAVPMQTSGSASLRELQKKLKKEAKDKLEQARDISLMLKAAQKAELLEQQARTASVQAQQAVVEAQQAIDEAQRRAGHAQQAMEQAQQALVQKDAAQAALIQAQTKLQQPAQMPLQITPPSGSSQVQQTVYMSAQPVYVPPYNHPPQFPLYPGVGIPGVPMSGSIPVRPVFFQPLGAPGMQPSSRQVYMPSLPGRRA